MRKWVFRVPKFIVVLTMAFLASGERKRELGKGLFLKREKERRERVIGIRLKFSSRVVSVQLTFRTTSPCLNFGIPDGNVLIST